MIEKDYWDEMQTIFSAWKGLEHAAHGVVQIVKPDLTVEIGTHVGYSLLALAYKNEGHTIGIDLFTDPKVEAECIANIQRLSMYENLEKVAIVKEESSNAFVKWDLGKADIIHIDGDHTYEGVQKDYDTWVNFMLKEGGVVLMHDVYNNYFTGPRKVFDESSLKYKILILDSLGFGILTDNKDYHDKIFNFLSTKTTYRLVDL